MEFEQQLEAMHEQFRELMGFVAKMTEENHSLQLENHHLRTRLDELTAKTQSMDEKRPPEKPQRVDIGEGVDNLARI